jgi:hypothetical protein
MKLYKAICAAALVLLSSPRLLAQPEGVKQITIKSSWAGLGFVKPTELLILRHGGSYRSRGKQIDARLVEALSAALAQPAITKPELGNLGITQEWLEEQSSKEYPGSFVYSAPNQRALYKSSFTSLPIIEQVVPELFIFSRTDDYPGVEVAVTFDDGTTLSATSYSQYLFMLPWKVTGISGTVSTYNADISRAVAALMPKKATNRYRIAGEGLASDLAEAVVRHVKNDLELLDAENRASDTLATLRTRYVVESAEINPYHGVVYGLEWKSNQPHEENLHATLRRESFPKGFSEDAILLYKDGKVLGTEDFLQNASKYENLAFSVPWLNGLLSRYPAFGVQLLWVHDRSFSEKAMRNFAADMDILGKDELASEVRAEQNEVALITVNYGDYWLILPDKRMILWRYTSVSGLLNFKSWHLNTRRCSDYATVTGGCVGALIVPDGTLVK